MKPDKQGTICKTWDKSCETAGSKMLPFGQQCRPCGQNTAWRWRNKNHIKKSFSLIKTTDLYSHKQWPPMMKKKIYKKFYSLDYRISRICLQCIRISLSINTTLTKTNTNNKLKYNNKELKYNGKEFKWEFGLQPKTTPNKYRFSGHYK